ncbi:MAG: ribbon-helix-helix domain-containing protein [Bacilli bacterium]|jgi:predicted DNA-binding protein|nr:ribbon-helix-helix domain-containing protein [Bacilli bacterium]
MDDAKKLTIPSKKYKGDSAVISARIPLELVKRIDEVAEQTGRTRNEIIMMCLDFALDNTVVSDYQDKK